MDVFRFIFSPISVNTYIIADKSGNCGVIDCGCYNKSEFAKLADFIDERSFRPVILLNTHCHLDHIFGNGMFREKYGFGAYCHKDDEYNRKDSMIHASFFGLKMEMPPEPEGYIVDGQEIECGSLKLKAIHVPGHAAGSLAFYCEDGGILFTGDALFAGTIGRTDLPGGNYETLINSIKSKLLVLPPDTIIYPGHGEQSTIGNEIKSNPYLKKL
jgi:hydroxyacylglutathione hydrolase